MADDNSIEEVVRLVFDSADFERGIKQVQNKISNVGNLFKEDGKFSKGIGRLDQRLEGLSRQAGVAADRIEQFIRPFEMLDKALARLDKLQERLEKIRRTSERLAAIEAKRKAGQNVSFRADVSPAFDSSTSMPGAQPRILDPRKELASLDAVQRKRIEGINRAVAVEEQGQDAIVRASLKGAQKRIKVEQEKKDRLAKINSDIRIQSVALENRTQDEMVRASMRGIKRRVKAEEDAARAIASAQRRATTQRLATANRQQANMARNFTIAAAGAGAMGNFRVASGLFGVGSAIRNFDTSSLKEGQSLTGGLIQQTTKLLPLIGTVTVGISALAAAAVGLKKGLTLEKEIARASTLFSMGSSSAAEFNESMRETRDLAIELSNQFNISTTEAVQGFLTALSAGIGPEELREFSLQASSLATALGSSFEQATDILTTLKDSYRLNISDLSRVNDLLFRSIDEGKFVISDLVTNLGRVAPIANTAGISIEDMLGTLAFLTRQGLKPSQAITSLAQFIQGVVNPSDKAKKKFEELGLQFGRTAVQGDKLRDFLNSLQGISFADIVQLFPEDRALRAAAFFSQSADEAERLTNVVKNVEAGAALEAQNQALDNTIDRFGRLTNTITNELGRRGMDVLRAMTDAVLGLGASATATEKELVFSRALDSVSVGTDRLLTRTGIFIDTFQGLFGSILGDRDAIGENFTEITKAVEAFDQRVINVAKRRIEAGDFVGGLEVLRRDLNLSEKEIMSLAKALDSGLKSEKTVKALDEIGASIRKNLVDDVNSAAARVLSLQNTIDNLTEEIKESSDKVSKKGLLSEETAELSELEEKLENTELQISKTKAELKKLAEVSFADTLAATSRAVKDLDAFFAEGDSDVLAGAIDAIRVAIGELQKSGIISDEDIAKAEQIRQTIREGLITQKPEGIRNFADRFSSFISGLSPDTEGIVPSTGAVDVDRLKDFLNPQQQSEADKLLGILKEQEAALKLQEASTERLLSLGAARGVEGKKALEDETKNLKKVESLLDKLSKKGVKKESKEDVKKFSVADLKTVDLQIAKQKELLELRIQQAQELTGITGKSEDALKVAEAAVSVNDRLVDLEKQRADLVKQRVDAVKKLSDDVTKLQEEDKKAFEDFEKEKTKSLKDELDRRRDLAKDFIDIFRAINDLRLENQLSISNTKGQQKLLKEQRQTQLGIAREAVEAGDVDVLEDAIKSALTTLTREGAFIGRDRERERFTSRGLDEIEAIARLGEQSILGKADAKVAGIQGTSAPTQRTKEQLLEQVLNDRAEEFRNLHTVATSLDNATVVLDKLATPIDALTFVATSTKDFLEHLLEQQQSSPSEVVDSKGKVFNINISGSSNDRSIRKIIDGVNEAEERGVFDNKFDRSNNIKSVNPTQETRTEKARGGAFGS